MRRRDFLQKSVALGAAAAMPSLVGTFGFADDPKQTGKDNTAPSTRETVPVAFVISKGAVVIDFCGPWEVFQDASVPGRTTPAFSLYTVAESLDPVQASAGMRIFPNYTFANAPTPKVIVIPAQRGQSEAMLQWIRSASKTADLTMSVCIGANLLAATGLLSGRPATTHHNSYGVFTAKNPDIHVKRGVRYVDDGNVASAGGLSSGIDLALHVVERYFGTEAVKQTTYYMEYFGEGWKNPDINSVYNQSPVATVEKATCAVCSMTVDAATAPKSTFNSRSYYFCSQEHKEVFEKNPKLFTGAA
jgi:putative intracellular protease/amidase/YHS domain-containing protein